MCSGHVEKKQLEKTDGEGGIAVTVKRLTKWLFRIPYTIVDGTGTDRA